MRTLLIQVSILALAGATPAIARDAAAGTTSGAMQAGTMTEQDVGAGLMRGTPSPQYVMLAADSDMYEIQSSKVVLAKSKNPQVKQFANEMIRDHMTTTKALMAALPKTEPKVPKPGKTMSAANAAKVAQLKQADAGTIDGLYMQQQMMAHQTAWSLHKGYATDGQDPALRQVATSAVPIIERHLQHLKTMPMSGGAM